MRKMIEQKCFFMNEEKGESNRVEEKKKTIKAFFLFENKNTPKKKNVKRKQKQKNTKKTSPVNKYKRTNKRLAQQK